jgi:O-antigen/teichoic acid export membrane protein
MSATTSRAAAGISRIGLATALSSLAGYALLALVGRALGPTEFGLFVAFWGVLFGVGSSLSTIEQEAARRAASDAPEGGPPAAAVTAAAAAIAGLVAAATLLPPVSDRLYGRSDSWIGVVVVVAALGFAAQFAVRGQLIGSGAVRGYSWLLLAEAGSRLVVLLALLALIRLDLLSAAIAVAVGSFAWLGWAARARLVLPGRGLPRGVWRAAGARAGSLMLGAALTASVITGFPTLVTALADGARGAAVGAVFAAITVSRVPLLLFSPVQAVAVPFVVRSHGRPGPEGTAALRRMLVLGTVGFLLLGGVAAAVGWAIGPWAVRVVYGDAFDVPAAAIALLLLSACLLAWVQLLSAALIALESHRGMLLTWAAAVAATVLWLVISPLDVVATTAIGSLVGPLAGLACAVPMLWGLARKQG